MIAVMSKSLKRIAAAVWTFLLVAVIVDFIKRWLGENYFSDPNITIVFNLAASIVQQRSFQFALVFLTGIVVGISLDWFDRKSDENKASELRTLGSKFRILSDAIKIQTADLSGWPNNIREHKADILSALISAKKFDLWVPDERVYELYVRFRG